MVTQQQWHMLALSPYLLNPGSILVRGMGRNFFSLRDLFVFIVPTLCKGNRVGGHSFEALEYLLEKELRGAAWEVF